MRQTFPISIALPLLLAISLITIATIAGENPPAPHRPSRKVQDFLGPRMLAILDNAKTVTAFRLAPINASERASEQMDGYPISDIAPEQPDDFAAKVLTLLYDDKTYDFDIAKACDPTPGVGLRITSPEGIVDILLCFDCNQLLLFTTDGKHKDVEHKIQNFDHARPAFIELAKKAFPNDKAIAALK